MTFEVLVDKLAGLGCVPSIGFKEEQPCNKQEPIMSTIEVNNSYETRERQDQRYRLRRAIEDSKEDKIRDLKEHYALVGKSRYQMSPKDLVVSIQSGKYRYALDLGTQQHLDDPEWWSNPLDGIDFIDPDRKPDYEAYGKAIKHLEEDSDNLRLDIDILEPKDVLKRVREFKEKKYH